MDEDGDVGEGRIAPEQVDRRDAQVELFADAREELGAHEGVDAELVEPAVRVELSGVRAQDPGEQGGEDAGEGAQDLVRFCGAARLSPPPYAGALRGYASPVRQNNGEQPRTVRVVPVGGHKEITEFIRFPRFLYRGDPCWVPPLEWERRRFLDRRHNPFFQYGEVCLFLARRGTETVGRIAAVRNPRYAEFQGEPHGFFGLFECVDDVTTAQALFDAVAGWLSRSGGPDTMLGPVSFSTNDECGMLVSGFGSPPTVMMPYNPPYYPRLMAACGFTKAKDLWAWCLDITDPPRFLLEQADRALRENTVNVRQVNLRDLSREVPRIMDIYNAAWERNWGSVPVNGPEASYLAARLRPVLRPELALIGEVAGVPAAFLLVVPDVNEALMAARGRLSGCGLPLGLVRLLRAVRRIEGLRLLGLGALEEHRRLGLDAVLCAQAWRAARRMGYRRAEISWVLEDNIKVNRMAEMVGARRHKVYRIYGRPLVSRPPRTPGRW